MYSNPGRYLENCISGTAALKVSQQEYTDEEKASDGLNLEEGKSGKAEVFEDEQDFIHDWPLNQQMWSNGDLNISAKRFCRKFATCSKDFLSLKKRMPITVWIRYYTFNKLLRDFIAGITVALTVVPQGMAYAQVAGLPPEYGLYAAYIGPIVYLLFGTSKDITMGPTAVMSLIVASYSKQSYPQYAVLLTFCGGLVQFLIGMFQLGTLINFVSHPVISGFTSGAALIIAYGQIPKLLGISQISSDHLFPQIYETFKYINFISWWDTILGVLCLAILLILRRVRSIAVFPSHTEPSPPMYVNFCRKFVWLTCIASNAIVIIMASLVVFLWETFAKSEPGFNTVSDIPAGNIPVGLPPFGFTDEATNTTVSFLDMVGDIQSGFAVVPLLGILESIAIAKSFGRRNGYRIDTTQELMAIGLSNIASSFFKSYPITGSFSRTAVNSQCNVATPLGGVFTSLIVLSALLFVAPAFKYIPESSLAALIIASIIFNFDYEIIKQLYKLKKIDFLTVIVTIGMCCLTSAEYGIISGICFSLIVSLCPMARPNLLLEQFRDGSLIIARFDHGLNFPSAEAIIDIFTESFHQYYKSFRNGTTSKAPSCCVIDLKRVWQIDQSVCASLATVKLTLETQNVAVYLIRACPSVLMTLDRATDTSKYGTMPVSWSHYPTLELALSHFYSIQQSSVPLVIRGSHSAPDNEDASEDEQVVPSKHQIINAEGDKTKEDEVHVKHIEIDCGNGATSRGDDKTTVKSCTNNNNESSTDVFET